MDTDPDPILASDPDPDDPGVLPGVESRWQDLVADLYIMSESDGLITVQVFPVSDLPDRPDERLEWLTEHGRLPKLTDVDTDEDADDQPAETPQTGFRLYSAHEFTDNVWKAYDDQTDLFQTVVDTIEAELDQVVYFSIGRLNILTGVLGVCRDKPSIGVLLTASVTWT
jgi:hypothetical protein